MKNAKLQTQETLWCLPYDTDSVFKPMLKISFSTYLNNIISNQYFPAYQIAMANQVKDRTLWNQKCWRLIQYFQYLNENFDLKTWDNYINFIQDNHLRSIMGYFRLWIDTQRLYLLNFLKLDSNQFQQDRIFMSLYRTLIIFNSLFNQYMSNDFDPTFLNNFIRKSIIQLQQLSAITTNDTAELIVAIIVLLKNIKKKEKILIEFTTLQTLKKSASIKVSKQGQMIRQVEIRLKNSAAYKKKLDEERRLKMICKNESIDQIINPVRNLYDPIKKIRQEYDEQFYGSPEEKQRRRQEGIEEKITNYKKQVKGPKNGVDVYNEINEIKQNPYDIKNYQVYGESVKINMDDKLKYQKVTQTEVVSVQDYDRSKLFYDQGFLNMMESETNFSGKVTVKDINTSMRSQIKKVVDFKNQQQNTRVFNLKWHQDPTINRQKRKSDSAQFTKDYDNNLLFKSPLEEQLLQNKRNNNLDRLKEHYDVQSYTIALLEQIGDQIHPETALSSQGSNYFVKKTPLTLDLRNFKFLNQNKFDFMRKVVGYMTAQKKIKDVLAAKAPPDMYPRYYPDVRQDTFCPQIQTSKINYALGWTTTKPQLYI